MVWDDEVTASLVTTVANAKGMPEDDLPPLYDSIESEALEQLFEYTADTPDADLRVGFSYAGCRVTVQGSGQVSVDQ